MNQNANDISIIDVFLYNGEPIVSLRLQLLHPFVSKFIIVESKESHSGLHKDEYYFHMNQDQFAPYMDKIQFIGIESFSSDQCNANFKPENYMQPGTENAWARERYQRNIAHQALKATPGPYLAMVCDVDEIPSPQAVQGLVNHYHVLNEPVYLEMDMFYYNFEWKKSYKWYHAYCINDKGFFANDDMSYFRTAHPKRQVLPNAGWHCSWFFPVKDIIRKLESFAHQEFNRRDLVDEDHITDCIRFGKDLLKREEHETLIGVPAPDLKESSLLYTIRAFHDNLVKEQIPK